MNISIYGENELLRFIRSKRELHSHCISITNPGKDTPDLIKRSFNAVLSLAFFDSDKSPKMSDIRKVVEFYNVTKADATGYVVHCHRGVSRSAAIALILLYLESGSEDESVTRLTQLNSSANPNPTILRLFDEIAGSKLYNTFLNLLLKKVVKKFSKSLSYLKFYDQDG